MCTLIILHRRSRLLELAGVLDDVNRFVKGDLVRFLDEEFGEDATTWGRLWIFNVPQE